MIVFWAILAVALTVILGWLIFGPRQDPNILGVEPDDQAVAQATATARATLPDFWAVFDHPQPGDSDFMLKVAVPDAKGVPEHIWIEVVERRNGSVLGRFDNDPVNIENKRRGDEVEVPDSAIEDWNFKRGDKLYGMFSTRALAERMPEAEQAWARENLSENPVPTSGDH